MTIVATQDQLKQAVAQAALEYVLPKLTPGSILGIGTGSTANFFIDLLAQHRKAFAGAVASSQTRGARLAQYGIRLYDLNDVEHIIAYVDGADEANANLELIKGGGAALTREKIVAAVATEFICIADASKWVATLGRFPLPVEVVPMARQYVARELQNLGGRPIYREGVITDNGNHILDVHDFSISTPTLLESQINQITGVVTNGLFARRPADILLLASAEGVKTLLRPGDALESA